MCGIFGAVYGRDPRITPDFITAVSDSLFRLSAARGREAAGLAVHDGYSIGVLKQAGSAASFLGSPRYRRLLDGAIATYAEHRENGQSPALAVTGHTRLVTNGAQSEDDNNQPVIAGGAVGIHNGIVVNHAQLWKKHPHLERSGEVDTEVLLALLRQSLDATNDVARATRETFAQIEGSASVAVFADNLQSLLLATNTGSLFYVANEPTTFFAFASERYILTRLLHARRADALIAGCSVRQLRAGDGLLISLKDLAHHEFTAVGAGRDVHATNGFVPGTTRVQIVDHTPRAKDMRRCTRCILPHTYPLIRFDEQGVCNYCRSHKKITVRGREALERAVAPYRRSDGSPDCIVAFSGGRDSSYGLHYIKTELGMNPVAFTYDWGMVTDLARRNQARVCGKLGVEHIVRSADITTKRRYIRKNIEAWLKRPELGMVTLFTAGDKEFYRHARQLREETGIKLVIFCAGNMIEDTPFKTGLCGIREDDHQMTLTGLSLRNKAAIVRYFLKHYLLNPAYFNESIWDTLYAYWCTFVVKDDFLYLYHYIPWEEETVVSTIRQQYDWEIATDTSTTWRIGDGSAAFYNYIYGTIAGWCEDEVLLSNQIREGQHTRTEALRLAAEFSKPRYPSIREYAQLAGFNCEEALSVINAAPKLF
ncbi:MAG: hypothetical protein WKG32_11400 [Gemmatimonadaceae bacterium]